MENQGPAEPSGRGHHFQTYQNSRPWATLGEQVRGKGSFGDSETACDTPTLGPRVLMSCLFPLDPGAGVGVSACVAVFLVVVVVAVTMG